MIKNNFAKISTMSVAATMALVASSMPLFAETKYMPVEGTTAMFEKYLVMEDSANVPNVTFKFSIAPGEAKEYDIQGEKFAVLAGVGSPVVEDVVFSSSDETFDSIQKSAIKNNAGAEIDDQVVLAADGSEKYARHEAVVDFSGVSFDEPGVYRYVISENVETDGVLGITNDANPDRIMDVYVVNDGVDEETGKPTLKIQGYVLHSSPDDISLTDENGSMNVDPEDKSKGFQNSYDTHDLTFSKKVDGNQASHDKYFMFTVKLTGARPGTVYDVDLSNADSTTGSNSATLDSYENKTNPSKLTADDKGEVTAIFYLQHGQSVKILGIADSTSYSVQEAEEDYKPSVLETVGKTAGEAQASNQVVSSKSGIKDDVLDEFTNTRSGDIATGVVMRVAPYAAVVLVAGAGIITLKMTKKKED